MRLNKYIFYSVRVGGEESVESYKEKIAFLFNAHKYTIKDKIILKDLFKNVPYPKVIVNDIHNLVGANNNLNTI